MNWKRAAKGYRRAMLLAVKQNEKYKRVLLWILLNVSAEQLWALNQIMHGPDQKVNAKGGDG